MSTEKMWISIFDRKQKEVDLFERKFLAYRNKMNEVLETLKKDNALPDLQNDIMKFMKSVDQEEQENEN